MATNSNRNYGIDLLRLVSMFLVVILHVLGQGGVLSAAHGVQYAVSWFLEITAYCAVNCYAIISGFVGYREVETKYHYAKYLSFWIPVFTYSFGISLCAYLLKPGSIGLGKLLTSALPVTTSKYWYVNAYTGLFFIIPWLNKFVRSCSKRELNQFALISFLLFSFYATFAGVFSDVFKFGGGYSFVWLTILYLIGAWMKKCDISAKLKKTTWNALLSICIFLTWVWKISIPAGSVNSLLVSYTSPTIVTVAICLVAIFSAVQPQKRLLSFVKVFSPAAFGVYIIHVHWIIWGHYLAGAFAWIATTPAWVLPFEVLGSVAAIFVICISIERIRISMFKLLRINQLISMIEK